MSVVAAGCGDDGGAATLDLGEHDYNVRPLVGAKLGEDGLYIVYLLGTDVTLIRGDRDGKSR
jgi:hypothetical protein